MKSQQQNEGRKTRFGFYPGNKMFCRQNKRDTRKWLIKYEYLEVKADKEARGILTLWNPQKLGILDALRNSHTLEPL